MSFSFKFPADKAVIPDVVKRLEEMGLQVTVVPVVPFSRYAEYPSRPESIEAAMSWWESLPLPDFEAHSEEDEARGLGTGYFVDTRSLSASTVFVFFMRDPASTWKLTEEVYSPRDVDDFAAVVSLLEVIPEWRERLPELRALGDEWSRLVSAWGEIEVAYGEQNVNEVNRLIEEAVRLRP